MMPRALLVVLCGAVSVAPSLFADVTGRWRVTIGSGDNAIVGVAVLEQSADKVTGSMGPEDSDTTPVSGTLKGDTLTLKTHPKPGFAVPFDTCELTVSGDRMTGSIKSGDLANTRVEFVRARAGK